MINSIKRFNNRKATLGRKIQYAPKYTREQILKGTTTIERERRARCFKNIKSL